jgi:hypothetical protein
MKARDCITWNDTDTLVATAEHGFDYDALPLMAGEPGAGTFSCACGKYGCTCDTYEDDPEFDAYMASLGF